MKKKIFTEIYQDFSPFISLLMKSLVCILNAFRYLNTNCLIDIWFVFFREVWRNE